MSNGSLRFQLHDQRHSLGQRLRSYIWSAPHFFSPKSNIKIMKKQVHLDDTQHALQRFPGSRSKSQQEINLVQIIYFETLALVVKIFQIFVPLEDVKSEVLASDFSYLLVVLGFNATSKVKVIS